MKPIEKPELTAVKTKREQMPELPSLEARLVIRNNQA
jgi:hypothetical protein